jgi:hypothetical protein
VKSDLFFVIFIIIIMRDVATESTADNLVENLISNKYNQGTSEDNPTQGEKDKSHHVEEIVTVGGCLGLIELDLE